ncbi:MAG: type II restriction endonuclease, partial [Eubacteriales bacterium]
FSYNFARPNQTVAQYSVFMRKTGLFELLEKRIVHNLIDYVTGVETGLDSNARKNRGGQLMERLVEGYLRKAGLVSGRDYFKHMRIAAIEDRWGLDLSPISHGGRTVKEFDFVVKTAQAVYGIETNFYASGGSKLNETARSYQQIAQQSRSVSGFVFVWLTDGQGWVSARHNLEQTFDAMEHLYSIADLEDGVMGRIFR